MNSIYWERRRKEEEKKKTIDGMDRDILRYMVSCPKIPPTSRQIANNVSLSGASILPRLDNLKSQGIIKQVKCGKIRRKTKAPSRICWGLDLKSKKSKK